MWSVLVNIKNAIKKVVIATKHATSRVMATDSVVRTTDLIER
jgi:hypothetical protein